MPKSFHLNKPTLIRSINPLVDHHSINYGKETSPLPHNVTNINAQLCVTLSFVLFYYPSHPLHCNALPRCTDRDLQSSPTDRVTFKGKNNASYLLCPCCCLLLSHFPYIGAAGKGKVQLIVIITDTILIARQGAFTCVPIGLFSSSSSSLHGSQSVSEPIYL